MALGGGTFTSQNKKFPGAYINFQSTATASATLSDRGVATMPLKLDWGPEDKIFEVTSGEFQKHSMKYFGYAYTDNRLKGLRDLFLGAQTLYAYRLNGGGTKASCDFATAKYGGTRGNDIKIVVQANVDDSTMYDCITYLGEDKVDSQTVSSAAELEDNDYVVFDKTATVTLTAATPLTGGENADATGASYQDYLDKAESYSFNTMGVVSTDSTINSLFASYCKRMRDELGKKFQLVVYNGGGTQYDYMGVIGVKNKVTDEGEDEASLVYWVTGLEAGCKVNKSCQNTLYNGEFTVNTDYTQAQLKTALDKGEFVLHRVNDDIRVLDDINTMVTTSDTMGEVFQSNQTIRVIDQIGNDAATLFCEKYLGVVPNDAAGRTSLWSDIVKLFTQLNNIRAIENFSSEDVTVTQGDSKKAVVVDAAITVVNAMSELYMTVTVS